MKIDKFEIKPHEFRHPIEIQRCVSGTDNDNIPVVKQWNKLIKTRAKIVTNKIITATAVTALHAIFLLSILATAQIAVTGALINNCSPIEINV